MSKNKLTLQQKINNLDQSSVLDVSNLKDNGTGIRKQVKPKNLNKCTKFISPYLPIISNNYDNYVKALHQLDGGINAHLNSLNYINKNKNIKLINSTKSETNLFANIDTSRNLIDLSSDDSDIDNFSLMLENTFDLSESSSDTATDYSDNYSSSND